MFYSPTIANWVEIQYYDLETVLENKCYCVYNYVFIVKCVRQFSKNQEQAQEHLVQRVWHQRLLGIAKTFVSVVSVLPLAIATLLDPRFKTLAFVRNTKADEAACVLICKCSQILNNQTAQYNITPHKLQLAFTQIIHCGSCLILILPRRICSRYSRWLSEPYETRSQKPLAYRQRNEIKYQTLVQFMKKYCFYVYWPNCSHVQSFLPNLDCHCYRSQLTVQILSARFFFFLVNWK